MTETRDCTSCGHTIPASLYLCDKCHTHLCALLDRVPDTLDTAQDTLSNMSVTPRVGSAGSNPPSAPVNLDMSDKLGKYIKRLVELAVWVNNTEEPDRLHIFTTPETAGQYLRRMTNLMRQRDYVGDLHQELRTLERQVLSTADRQLVKRPLGECGALHLDEEGNIIKCAGVVYGHETATTGRCKACKREHDLTDRITSRLAEATNYRAPLQRIVKVLNVAGFPVNYERAKKWAQRGKLAPSCDVETRREGHTPAEVLKVLQEMSN
ncbi:hypothetical protein DFO58_2192 [Arthrobacter sp. AG1021]|uniref:hypothetical protein n=1 Tax=Arthrobacter sp. AG1021 TaxID=2183908 RepID=UPI000EB07E03|nr:hypothetical protein [Arthrobacter sp. AG1021]RKS19689.1 hypothetical protein DFO58_2192 [Arthrobacter sp. AG1021]